MNLNRKILSYEAIFCDGELEYSAFEGGYFDPEGGTMYYLTDWQGNNAAVVSSKGDIVQKTAYYPYGEPTVEPAGQRFLFGGKEREHAAGRNTYDFSARCLTPYGNWNVVDPKAEDNYQHSLYVYCDGDPINHIDPTGKWKILLSNHNDLNIRAKRQGYDSKIHVFAHGNTELIHYDKKDKIIHTASGLISAIKESQPELGKLLSRPVVEIVLHSCQTGKNPANGSEPLAQKISRDIPNAIITAPNGTINIDRKGKETVVNDKGEAVKEHAWRVFFRGKEMSFEEIDIVKERLLKEKQLETIDEELNTRR